jgi:hypothetical protein
VRGAPSVGGAFYARFVRSSLCSLQQRRL